MPSDWQRAKAVFNSALDVDKDERAEFLVAACNGDDELRQHVEELLSSYNTNFLENGRFQEDTDLKKLTLKPGSSIGHFEIIRLLGSGGMGQVYLARDGHLDRRVAIKVFSQDLAENDATLRRFVREAQAASALNHPNICTIYEIDPEHEPPYIAMEYIDGETVAEKIAEKKLEIKEAIDIALQAAEALAEAHDAGIVHRDIKPANIIVNKRGQAKILDFGLAKRVTADLEGKTQQQLSVSGVIMGTVSYMSPEQVKGEPVDARSDIFSFGVLLYEMISGRRPFDSSSMAETMALILTATPQPLMVTATDLDGLLSKCLEKDKTQRWQSMHEVVAGLKAICHRGPGATATELQEPPTIPLRPVKSEHVSGESRYFDAKEGGRQSHGIVYVAAFIVLVVAGLAGAGWLYTRQAAAPINSLAVMPMLNQIDDPASDYLGDGITESLIGRLSQIPNLSVKARSSVFRFKGKDVAIKDIGKELNVPAVLTGRVARRGGQLSLYIELVDTATENVIWRGEYDRPESGLAAIPGEMARDVASGLRQKLSGADEQKIARNYTENSTAYELYLKGRYYWDKRTEESYKIAEEAYNQAITLDPNYALAYAGLADCYLFREVSLGRDVAMPKAKEYALKALDIDESLAEAHTTLAFVNANYDLDFSSGEREFKRAIELKPNYAVAHQFYGSLLIAVGRTDEALAEMRRAVELEPYTVTINWSLGMGLGLAHRYDESIAQLQKTLQLQPGHALAEGNLAGILIHSGRYDEAMSLVQKHLAMPERRDSALSNLAIIFAKTGRNAEAQNALKSLFNETKSQNNPYSIAKVYAALGENDKAVEWLNKAVERRSFSVWFMRADPFFDNLHNDPRFDELLGRIGLG